LMGCFVGSGVGASVKDDEAGSTTGFLFPDVPPVVSGTLGAAVVAATVGGAEGAHSIEVDFPDLPPLPDFVDFGAAVIFPPLAVSAWR